MGLDLYGSLPLLLYAIWDSWAAFMNYMDSVWLYYIIFIVLALIGAAIMYFLFPETKRLTLEEIGKKLGDHVAVDLTAMSEEGRARLAMRLAKDEPERVAA